MSDHADDALRAALAKALHIQPQYPCDCQSWPCETYEEDFWLDIADEVIACMPALAIQQRSKAGLDVERLARAKAIVDENSDTAWEDDPPMQDTWRDEARMLLKEYARLSRLAA